MDTSVFAHALLMHKPDSREGILALLPAETRSVVETELTRLASFSSEQVRESLRALRETRAALQREKAEAKIGSSLKHASPRLVAWLARPF
jgi:predicted nucleic acid-binding protein